jgi:hypothetical protein
VLKAPDFRKELGRVAELLRSWDEPDKLILPLEHVYTPGTLVQRPQGSRCGRGVRAGQAAAAADCDLHLALVSIEESGSAEHTGYYGRRRRSRDEDEEEEFEVAEIIDRALILSEWRHPDGGEAGFGDFPFAEDELCRPTLLRI